MSYTHATCVMVQPQGTVRVGEEYKTLCGTTDIFDPFVTERCPDCVEAFNKFPCKACGLSLEYHPLY